MSLIVIIALAIIQGLAELLPVSSSAHVVAAEKLLGIDPSSPQATLLLIMLHTGTMFAVIVYFWKAWRRMYFSSKQAAIQFGVDVAIATVVTLVVGGVLILGIEHVIRQRNPGIEKAEVEQLFSHLDLLAFALAAGGVLILYAGMKSSRRPGKNLITTGDAIVIGAVQGLALPFRGFSRSGSTISAGMLRGISKTRLEEYSFALAVVLTPFAVGREVLRLIKHHAESTPIGFHDFRDSLLGMGFSFIAGLVALKVLSQLLVKGQWWVFGEARVNVLLLNLALDRAQ